MIHFKIVTPERILLETEVDSVTLPTRLGEITVLQNHIPLVASLVAGEVRYRTHGQESFFAVSGGFIEVRKNHEVVVLADTAEFGHEIDEHRAEEARQKAQEIMRGSYHDQKSHATASAVLEKNLARLKVARKHRSHAPRIDTNS
ncbi:MAG: ATP synthase F1 subunit epsilon [Candidatus Doudnabacteria bacterium]|nr:ATP synthase F1 subunit epsilon [Candidatus Doudnabacteria bacterium]